LSSSYFVLFENPTLPSISVLMSSGIDNSGTGEGSGKKSRHKINKSAQILIHGSPVEQQSASVPHENRQETTTTQSSNRILPIHAEQMSIANLTSTHSKVRDTILSPGRSSANLMIIAGVQELHGSTFDATVMQTDPKMAVVVIQVEEEVKTTRFPEREVALFTGRLFVVCFARDGCSGDSSNCCEEEKVDEIFFVIL
jgi:hypothetical protein